MKQSKSFLYHEGRYVQYSVKRSARKLVNCFLGIFSSLIYVVMDENVRLSSHMKRLRDLLMKLTIKESVLNDVWTKRQRNEMILV